VSDVIIARFNSQHLYAGLIRGWAGAGVGTAGVYRSVNGGGNWTLMGNLPYNLFLGAAVRLESATTTGTVYVTLFYTDIDGTDSVLRYKTTDGGTNWKKLTATSGTPELRTWHVVLAVDPRNANHVFANDEYQLFESTNGGVSWNKAEAICDDWVNMTFDANNNGVVTADRNIYLYEPKTKKWSAREGNLQVTQLYDITLDPQNVDQVYGVSQDHWDAMKYAGSILWNYMSPAGGEIGKVIVDPTNTNRLYVSDPLDPVANLVVRSTNGGSNWKTIFTSNNYQAVDYDLAYSVQKSFVADPQNSKRLLIGLTQVFQCKDATVAAPSWAAMSNVLSPSSAAADQYITALAIAPSSSQTIYAATADAHIWMTANNGSNWNQNDTGFFGTGAGKIVDLRIDPKNPKRVVAASSGPGGKTVWLLNPANGQWQNISGNLPANLQVASVCVDWTVATPVLYAGTSRACYRSTDMGVNWQKFGLYLPNTVVTDLQILPSPKILAAGTFGRGVWEILLAERHAGAAKPKAKARQRGPTLIPAPEPFRYPSDLVQLPGRVAGQSLVHRRAPGRTPKKKR
jgi:photosystem II stability/assembly factor-like uncharacterized protein